MRRIIKSFIAILLLIIGIGNPNAYSQTSDHSPEVREIIEKSYARLTQLIKEGKPAEIAQQFYTKDAKFFPPNGGVAEGRAAIEKAFSGLINAGLVIAPEPQEVEKYGNEAIYEYGIATLYNKEGKKLGKERYIVILKKENGKWKMYRDFVKGKQIE